MEAFKLSSEQCELLTALEAAGSIRGLAQAIGRDESVVSRQIKHIASLAPVLEKIETRWRVSELGKQIVQWSRDSMESQRRILSQHPSLRIATTREFSARVLCPDLRSLIGKDDVAISIFTSDDGIEGELLAGRADIGIDCGRPEDPLVKFKSVLLEPYVVVASPGFLKQSRVKKKEDLLDSPHLKFNRDPAVALLQLEGDIPNVLASFNDLGSVKAACCAGLGWATLPRYCIATELKAGLVKEVLGWKIQERSFGVWWVRERASLTPWIDRTVTWLKRQRL